MSILNTTPKPEKTPAPNIAPETIEHSQHYAILTHVEDKHPGLPYHSGAPANIAGMRWFPVTIIDGYSTLDRDTVTKILTFKHGERFSLLSPQLARPYTAAGNIDFDATPTHLG